MSEQSFVGQAALVDSWPKRRVDKAHAITAVARRLAAERGVDEFTLDELAHECGVSRRTLFNYFPGKMEAMLGLPPSGCSAMLETFRAGGPTGHLLTDTRVCVDAVVRGKIETREELANMHLALERNPKLMAAALAQFRQLAEELVAIVAEREGVDRTHPRAIACVALLVGTLEAATRVFVEDNSERELAEIFSELLNAQAQLFAPPT